MECAVATRQSQVGSGECERFAFIAKDCSPLFPIQSVYSFEMLEILFFQPTLTLLQQKIFASPNPAHAAEMDLYKASGLVLEAELHMHICAAGFGVGAITSQDSHLLVRECT